MRRAVLHVVLGALLVGACSGGKDGASETSAASTTKGVAEPLIIRTSLVFLTSGEQIATGVVLEGSTLGGSPFCVDGTIVDSAGSFDAAVEPYGLMDRTITCPDGTVRLGFTPQDTQGPNQTGSWRIVSGTGAFARLRGSGELEVVRSDPDAINAPAREKFTGTVTR